MRVESLSLPLILLLFSLIFSEVVGIEIQRRQRCCCRASCRPLCGRLGQRVRVNKSFRAVHTVSHLQKSVSRRQLRWSFSPLEQVWHPPIAVLVDPDADIVFLCVSRVIDILYAIVQIVH